MSNRTKRFMTKPDYWIDTLEHVYHAWAKKGRIIAKKQKQINKEIQDLDSIEKTIISIEMKLRDMGVAGFEYSAIES